MSARPSLTERLFRLLLRLFPRSLRQDFGDDMLEVLRQLEAGEPRRAAPRGRLARVSLVFRTAVDGITAIARSHLWEHQWARKARTVATPAGDSLSSKGNGPMSTLRQDLVVAFRSLLRSPGFTAVAVLTLALGIGANTAIFSVVYGVLVRPLALEDPAGLAVLTLHRSDDPGDVMGFWPGHFEELRRGAEGEAGVRRLTGFFFESLTLQADGRAEEISPALMVDARFFEVLGVPPLHGRALRPDDIIPGRRGQVCVLSESWWRRRYGADPGAVGRTLHLDGEPVTVVGVMPSGVPMPQVGIHLWMPYGWDGEDSALWGRLGAMARLEPGEPADRAGKALARTATEAGKLFPRLEGYTVSIETFHDSLVGPARSAILAAAGAVGLILLIACANMAGLLLSRAATREREMATRRALGARGFQVVCQLLAESLVLAVLGGACGILLAFGLHRVLLGLASDQLPRLYDVHLDLPVLVFAALASLMAGVFFGLAPVVYTFTRDLAGAMRGALGRSSAGGRGLHFARQGLVVVQVSMAVMLVTGAALMVRSLLELRAVDPGFNTAGVGGARIYLDDDAYPTDAREALYFERLLDRLRAAPDVNRVGASSGLPMDPLTIDYDLPYIVAGDDRGDDAPPQAFFRTITPGYLETMGIPLVAGRDLDRRDRADGEDVALINETFARTAWPDADPLGKTFSIYGGRRELRVVGIVGDVHFHGPGQDFRPEFFVPFNQFSYGALTVVARGIDGDSAARAVAREALALDPAQPVNSTLSLDSIVDSAVSTERFYTRLLIAFAAIALLLAAAGVYGVISYWVNESRQELGVRMALGADSRAIVFLVLKRSLSVCLLGLGAGLFGAVFGTRALEQFLFEIPRSDSIALMVVTGILFSVALAASLAPALRAARTEPLNTLRVD